MHDHLTVLVAALGLAACVSGAPDAPAFDGPGVAIDVAARNLQGVGDVVWDLEVVNGAAAPQIVWQRRISSSAYGDGAGSASYVGPCDASADANPNTVKVWVVGVYSAAVSALGSFASGGDGGVTGAALPFENPTSTGPLSRVITCSDNADVSVQFDVSLMRPAEQGFFDVAVSFNDIFCSAKFDCCDDADGDGCDASGDEDIELLFQPGGARGPTMVLGLACTATVGTTAETELYLDALELDCTAPTDFDAGFEADIVIDPSGAAGNQCTAGLVGDGNCTVVTEPTGNVDADDYLYQVGVYRGVEQLTSGGEPAQKVYWNVALGVDRDQIGSCWLRTRGTAADANDTSVIDGGVVAEGAVYPYMRWELDLDTCGSEELTVGAPDAMLAPDYTETTETEEPFEYEYGTNTPPGPVTPPCYGFDPCPLGLGFTFDVSTGWWSGGGKVYVQGGIFEMGSDVYATWDAHCVEVSGFGIDRTEVTALAYQTWCLGADPSFCTPSKTFVDTEYSDRSTEYPTYLNPDKEQHPINYVSWNQAQAYCGSKGGALCTEAQWEFAAHGTTGSDYPWGSSPPIACAYANGIDCSPVDDEGDETHTEAVGSYSAGASPFGALDMFGNVAEYTADWFSSSFPSVPACLVDPQGAALGSQKVTKGGAFNAGAGTYIVIRQIIGTNTHSNGVGIRCCY